MNAGGSLVFFRSHFANEQVPEAVSRGNSPFSRTIVMWVLHWVGSASFEACPDHLVKGKDQSRQTRTGNKKKRNSKEII